MKLLAAEGPRRHVYKPVRVLGCVGRVRTGEKRRGAGIAEKGGKDMAFKQGGGKEGRRRANRQADLARPCSP